MNTPAPIKVTDLVQKSLEALDAANSTKDEDEAVRLERKARVYEGLASAQSAKTANVIAYLNSDHSLWDPTDHRVVRIMLGLHDVGEDTDGGTSVAEIDDQPVAPPSTTVVDETEEDVEDTFVPTQGSVEAQMEQVDFA